MFKGIIFDLDGTLLDTIETISYYGNNSLKRHGLNPVEPERYKLMAGNGAVHLVKCMIKEAGCTDESMFEKVFEDYNRTYGEDTLYKTKVYEGIMELLSGAKEKGMKLAVLSNKPHDATIDVLGKFFKEGTFDLAFGARDGIPLKPDPTSAIELAKELGISKDECIYVGDTSVDMQTGKGAGFFAVGVLWGFRDRKELEENGADKIVSHPSEILDLI